MHYDGNHSPTAAMSELMHLLSEEFQAHKPLAALRKVVNGAAKPVEQADDCLQPCPEIELGYNQT